MKNVALILGFLLVSCGSDAGIGGDDDAEGTDFFVPSFHFGIDFVPDDDTEAYPDDGEGYGVDGTPDGDSDADVDADSDIPIGGEGEGEGEGEGKIEPDCSDGLTLCGEICVDLMTDNWNCGECGVVCAETQNCVDGVCIETNKDVVCAEGLTLCGEECVDLMTDPYNCGVCFLACKQCVVGVCVNGETGECEEGEIDVDLDGDCDVCDRDHDNGHGNECDKRDPEVYQDPDNPGHKIF